MSQNSGNYIVRLHILPNIYSQVVLLMRVSTQVMVYFCGCGSNDSLIFRAFFWCYFCRPGLCDCCSNHWCLLVLPSATGWTGWTSWCLCSKEKSRLPSLLALDRFSLSTVLAAQCLWRELSSQALGEEELSQARCGISSMPVLLATQALSVERGVSGLPLDRQNYWPDPCGRISAAHPSQCFLADCPASASGDGESPVKQGGNVLPLADQC